LECQEVSITEFTHTMLEACSYLDIITHGSFIVQMPDSQET